jgi:hypothetical protein
MKEARTSVFNKISMKQEIEGINEGQNGTVTSHEWQLMGLLE